MQHLARTIQATLSEEDAQALVSLVEESGLSRWRWVRGAIRAASADPVVAAAIVTAAPPDGRGGARSNSGGARPGAGRKPRRTSDPTATAKAQQEEQP